MFCHEKICLNQNHIQINKDLYMNAIKGIKTEHFLCTFLCPASLTKRCQAVGVTIEQVPHTSLKHYVMTNYCGQEDYGEDPQ